MKNYHITKLFFGKGYSNFYKAISQRDLYLANTLDYKLKKHFFF